MRIAFIRPSMTGARSRDAMEPLVFAILAARTPRAVETVLYDERLAPIPLDAPADLAAITVETYTARRAYQIADAFRARGVPVVMGGIHATLRPEEALEHVDCVVTGEAEAVWPTVVRDAARGRLQPRYQQDELPPLDNVQPDRRIFAGKRYAPAA
ncbi:MAG: cobalamin-dependent protein [Caldilineaceae bacterium]|nr:cobalamin-dependent protein [Caldilineaceae bacterium]